MVSITLSVPEEVRELMKKFPEVNWSGYIRKAIEGKARTLDLKEKMLAELQSEQEFDSQALQIGNKIKQSIWEKYKKEGW